MKKDTAQNADGIVTLGYVSNPDSDTDLDSVVQFQSNGETDNAGVFMPYGLSANIPKGATLVLLANNGSSQNRMAYGSFPENRFRDLKEWEVKIGNYKTKAHIFYADDGKILFNKDLNDSTDHMVRFSKLLEGFDQAVSDLNDAISAIKTHVHVSAAPGISTGPAVDGSQIPIVLPSSNASIDLAKIEEFMVPESGEA
jgi:hypothetical protein